MLLSKAIILSTSSNLVSRVSKARKNILVAHKNNLSESEQAMPYFDSSRMTGTLIFLSFSRQFEIIFSVVLYIILVLLYFFRALVSDSYKYKNKYKYQVLEIREETDDENDVMWRWSGVGRCLMAGL